MKNKVRIEIEEDVWRWVKTEAVKANRTTSETVELLLVAAQVRATREGVPMDKKT